MHPFFVVPLVPFLLTSVSLPAVASQTAAETFSPALSVAYVLPHQEQLPLIPLSIYK